jgi:hypothetical protein
MDNVQNIHQADYTLPLSEYFKHSGNQTAVCGNLGFHCRHFGVTQAHFLYYGKKYKGVPVEGIWGEQRYGFTHS